MTTSRWRPARLSLRLALPLILLGLAFAGALGRAHLAGEGSVLDRVEATLADIRLLAAGPRPAPRNIAIVAIDDRTVAAEGGYPLPRARLADLVSRIGAMRPKALALDILLADPGDPAADAALAAAFARLPHVLAAAGTFDRRPDQPRPDIPATAGELWPAAPFFDPDAVGLVNVATDPSGAPRFFPLVFETSRGFVPSFVLRAASLLRGTDPVLSPEGLRFGPEIVPLDLGRHLPVRSLGPGGTVETISARDVLAGAVAPDRLAGRLVLVGVTATAIGDTFGTAFDAVVPGVEVLAGGVASLARGEGLRRDATVRRLDAAATLVAAGVGAALVAFAPLLLAVSLSATVLALWLGAAVVLYGEGVWISMTLPLAGVLPPLLVVFAARQLAQRRSVAALARMESEFRRFQPPAFAARLASDPNFLRAPAERDAGILFVDLAGFTRLSETLGSARIHDFLRRYHSLIEGTGEAHGGAVMNFMGDGAMVLFGVPDPTGDDAARTLAATFALRAAVEDWIAETGLGRGFLGVRLGAHFGRITLSRLGAEAHQQITSSGDNVNVAARLMEVAKQQRAVVVASRDLLDAAGPAAEGRVPPPTGAFDAAIRGREGTKGVAFWR
ncbi:CHASE2 domain-containing protein [Aureimonas leprariae]|uniref:Adenylate/guanylate cyclase domain-containing protein n=1 Tax=Plantimonas leprariae TaxID=2615207 RepID=A0A7V7PRC3_9HYPH|nr:adenylate/guanylate cyclase domain-containing protein [Aureimonas leprariae]KAB0681260.1 adenylate/guanylate cyclase domain-containing protein [Aureimonas leprariae]